MQKKRSKLRLILLMHKRMYEVLYILIPHVSFIFYEFPSYNEVTSHYFLKPKICIDSICQFCKKKKKERRNTTVHIQPIRSLVPCIRIVSLSICIRTYM